MTDDLNNWLRPDDRARTRSPAGYDRGPLLAGAAIAALLVPALVLGCIGAANAITTNAAVSSSLHTEAPPTPVPGDEAPGADDPATPPDRDSDQTMVQPQDDKETSPENELYYIQAGDTLTTLSAKFDLSVDYIAEYNAVRDVDVISEGAVLRMPFDYDPPAPGKADPKD